MRVCVYFRYPTFTDALRDIDDALAMLFLFSSLPQYRRLQVDVSSVQLVGRRTIGAASW